MTKVFQTALIPILFVLNKKTKCAGSNIMNGMPHFRPSDGESPISDLPFIQLTLVNFQCSHFSNFSDFSTTI